VCSFDVGSDELSVPFDDDAVTDEHVTVGEVTNARVDSDDVAP
jgi:hypothetical protein